MATSPLSPFKQETKITKSTFTHELKKKGALSSPLFNGVDDPVAMARKIYDYIVEKGHSAEVWLGIVGKESSWGTNPDSVLHRGDTRSWTNARTTRHPQIPETLFDDPQRGSSYVKYKHVFDSIRDGIYRVDDPDYAYVGKTTIGEVIKVWAPAEDSNDPEGYAWWIANYVDGLRARETPIVTGGDFKHIPWIPADERHFTKGRTVDWPNLGIGHHTNGWDSLAWLTTSPNSDVSATVLMNHDGTPRAQLVRLKDTPHTTGHMNSRSWSSEWERKWPDQKDISEKQYRNIGRTIADIVIAERLRGNPHFKVFGPENYGKHRDYSNTTACPENLDTKLVWEIADELLNRDHPKKPDSIHFPETGRHVMLGFKAFFEELETYQSELPYRVLGLPTTNEGDAFMSDERRIRVQFFERAILKWDPEAASPWDIHVMRRDEAEGIIGFSEDLP